ncbi:GEVED domain-containing protein [Winogradskyella pacifica]|uniref:GEVED domain-containing protein n=1 Tax=Winogradskyella pacifica TaxID=664642 RepID=UPI0015CE441D|nr:GEVED domain-containing protein [Winogradskyella pacifica]
MKHIYTFLIALFIGSFGFAQGTETFSNIPTIAAYNDGNWTGDDGSTWEATNSRSDQPIDGKAITLNDDAANTYIQSGTISGGIGDITITTQRKFSGSSGTLDVLINGSSVGTIPYSGSVQSTTISGVNISGDIVIRIDNNIGGSNGGGADRVAIDDITWTAAGPTCAAPTTQASLYNTTALGTASATLNWTPGNGDEVLVVVNEGSPVDTDPENGIDYEDNTAFTSGDEIGTGNYVVYSGITTNSVSITGLSEATTYHVAVYEYNTIDTCYELTELTGSFTTECSTPSEVNTFTATAGNEEVDLTWSNGSCYDEILVIAKETSAVTVTPTGDGSAYTANATFGSSADLGTSEYAVYKGIGTSVTVTGLTNGNTYHFSVFTRKATSWSAAVADDATLACTAPAIQASTFTTLSPTTTDVSIEFTRGGGDDVLVVMKEGSAVDTDPTSGTSYNANSIFNGSGASEIGTGNYVVFNGNNGTSNPGTGGSSLSISVSGLNPNTTYHLAIYEYNTTNTCYNLIEFTGDFTTVCSTPSDVTAFTAEEGTTEVDLTWSNGSCFDEILVIAKETSAVSVTPTGDGSTYTANTEFGSGSDLGTGEYVVYKGTGTSVTVTGLTNGTTYHFEVFARKATIWSTGVTANAVPDLTWCTVSGTTTFDTSITLVNFGTINKASGQGSGYDDFTAESTDAIQGSDIDLTVNLNTDGAYTIYAKAWIDWNQDGTFDTSTEEYALGTANDETDGPTTLSPLTISVPAGATLGNTRMRVTCQYDSYTGPCTDSTDGEIEDYTINVIAALNNDTDTEVYVSTPQVAETTIVAADATTSGTAFDALGFIVEDFGSGDTEPTNITTMRFVPGPNNTADWSDHIQGVTLLDGNVMPYSPTATITDTEIVLTFGTPVVVANGTSLEFLLGLYLNETAIVDGSIIQLQIDESASGFETDMMGSGLADPFLLGDVVGNEMTIDVDATELVFSQQPSDTELNAVMAPSVTVSGVDANGNLDTNYNLDIVITSTGTLTGTPVTETAVSGIATFSTLTHTAIGTGLELTADDGLLSTFVSTTFDITEPVVGATDLFFSEYIEGSSNNKYIEIYNGTGVTVTLTDYSVELYANGSSSPNNTEDFSSGFPATLANGEVIVLENSGATIYGGTAYSSGVCNFNGDDAIVLKKDSDIIDIIGNIGCDPGSEWSEGSNYTSDRTLVRNSDVCGGVTVDPASCTFPTLESEWTGYSQNTISGLGSHTATCGAPTTYTYNGTWSPSDPNGAATASDDIVITLGDATIDTNTTANSITVNAGAGLTVDTGITLTVTNGLLLESVSDSYSSLILDGIITGTINYERHVNGNTILEDANAIGNNDLITPPLSGQTFGDFVAANSNLLTNPGDATEKAFAIFDKSTGDYENYNTNDNAGTLLVAGTGYRAASDNTSTLIFTGTANSGDIDINIDHSGPSYLEWNLIGNPYPSYLDIEAFLAYEVDTDIKNIDLLGDTSGIYGYDGDSSNGWDIINLANASGRLMTPGQGFLVGADAANVAAYDLEFKAAMRTTGSGDDFIAGRDANTLTFLKLNARTTTQNYTTQFYFNANATKGLDAGYDATIWGGTAPNFSLFSHLVEDNSGLPIALQTLDVTDLSNVTIPLGVNANQGEQLTFSINASTLSSTVSVYLEDNVANTSTLLNTTDYVLTPSTTLSGVGRFYLRVANSTLSTIDNTLDQLSIYTNKADKTIVIAGQLLEPTTASVYDVQGRLVSTTQLQTTVRSQAIDVSNLSPGIYVVKLHNAAQNKTQKVIIR